MWTSLEMRVLFEGGLYMRKYGKWHAKNEYAIMMMPSWRSLNFTILGVLLERGRTYSRCGPNYEKRPSLLTSVQFIDAVGVK